MFALPYTPRLVKLDAGNSTCTYVNYLNSYLSRLISKL